MPIESSWTNVNTKLYVRVGICEQLSSGVTRAVVSAHPIDWVPIEIYWTARGIYTVAGTVEVSVVRAPSHTLVPDHTQSKVGKVVLGTSSCAGSV